MSEGSFFVLVKIACCRCNMKKQSVFSKHEIEKVKGISSISNRLIIH